MPYPSSFVLTCVSTCWLLAYQWNQWPGHSRRGTNFLQPRIIFFCRSLYSTIQAFCRANDSGKCTIVGQRRGERIESFHSKKSSPPEKIIRVGISSKCQWQFSLWAIVVRLCPLFCVGDPHSFNFSSFACDLPSRQTCALIANVVQGARNWIKNIRQHS